MFISLNHLQFPLSTFYSSPHLSLLPLWSGFFLDILSFWGNFKRDFFFFFTFSFRYFIVNVQKHNWFLYIDFVSCSVQFSCSFVSDSLQSHEWQHARLPCPSPTPGACSNSCPSSWWCHPTISSTVIPFSPAFNLSQHQGLFQWVSYLHQVAKVLELQHQTFQWVISTDFL